MCGLTEAASPAQQEQASMVDTHMMTALNEQAQPMPASPVSPQRLAVVSQAPMTAAVVAVTPPPVGKPTFNAHADVEMTESPTLPTQVEHTPKIHSQGADLLLDHKSKQPAVAAPSIVQSSAIPETYQPESDHCLASASRGQPALMTESAWMPGQVAEEAPVQRLPATADREPVLPMAAQPSLLLPTPAPVSSVVHPEENHVEAVGVLAKATEHAAPPPMHLPLGQADVSHKPSRPLSSR